MKGVIITLLIAWSIGCFGQNYADSVLILLDNFPTEEVGEKDSALFITYRHVFEEGLSDTLTLDTLDYVINNSNDPKFWNQLNELRGRWCQQKLAKELPAPQKRFYRVCYASYLSYRSSYLRAKDRVKESLEIDFQSLEYRKQLRDTALIVSALQSIGVTYFNEKEFEQAKNWWEEAAKLQQITGDSVGINTTYGYLGAAILRMGQPKEAIPYLEKDLAYAQSQQNQRTESQALHALGVAYQRLGQFEQARAYFQQSLTLSREWGSMFAISTVLTSLAKVSGDLEEWDNALAYASEVYEMGQQHNYNTLKTNAASALWEIYEQMGRYKESLEMYQEFVELLDTTQTLKNEQTLIELKAGYEHKQQMAIDSMQNAIGFKLQIAENKRRKTQSYFLAFSLFLAVVVGLVWWNRFRVTRSQKQVIENEKQKLDHANEQLQALDEAKSRFFTNISHEFRTPLTVILGMVDQIERQPEKWLSQGMAIIKRNGQDVLQLINQILDLRKLESGKMEAEWVYEDIITYLSYLTESFHSMALPKGVSLTFQSEIEMLSMEFDKKKLLTIISNLLTNAIKFTQSGGSVKLVVLSSKLDVLGHKSGSNVPPLEHKIYPERSRRTQNSKLKTPNLEPSLEIRISDTGKGIPPEKLPHIFDRFYQVDDSLTREEEGTGIGLTLVKELVKFLGGEVTVQSELGKGTVFTIQLPIKQDDLAIPASSASPVPNLRVPHLSPKPQLGTLERSNPEPSSLPTLLLAEDNEDVIQYLVACLEEHYELLITRNGQEGIDKALEKVPDLIISDVMMPKKDGFALCETLKTDERTSHVPIVLLTAKADVESRISGLKRGADAYLAKPFNQDELLVQLETLLKLRQQLQARYQKLEAIPPTDDVAVKEEDAFILKLNEIIMAHLSDSDLTVTQLCEIMGMSRTQLHNKIKALTGQAASAYLRLVRLKEAQKLLMNTDMNISEIAYQVGFNDPGYFTRSFVKAFGVSPSEGRK